MDFDIRKDVLLRALERCSHPTGKEDLGKAYAGLTLLSTNDDAGTIGFYAVDTYCCVDTVGPAETIRSGGRQAIDTKQLTLFVTNIPDEIVSLRVTDSKLTVSGKYRRKYTAPVVGPEIFPHLSEPKQDAPSITIAGPKLAVLLKRVEHGIAGHDRPHLSGVKLMAEPHSNAIQRLRAVTMNSHTLCVVEHKELVSGTLPFEAFVPLRFLKAVLAFAEAEESITLHHDPPMLFVETQDSLIGGLLPREPFGNYEAMLSLLKPEPVCTLARIALQDALKAIDSVRSRRTASVRCSLAGPTLQIDLWDDEMQASDAIPINMDGDAEHVFNVDPKYMIEHLKAASADCNFELAYGTIGGQQKVTGMVLKTDDGYYGILMPTYPQREDTKPQADAKPATTSSRKKKTSKKTSKKEPPPEEDDDELGSADPSRYHADDLKDVF